MFAWVCTVEVCISPTLNSPTRPLTCLLVFFCRPVKGDVDF